MIKTAVKRLAVSDMQLLLHKDCAAPIAETFQCFIFTYVRATAKVKHFRRLETGLVLLFYFSFISVVRPSISRIYLRQISTMLFTSFRSSFSFRF